MKRCSAALALALVLGSTVCVVAAPAPQPLSIEIRGDGARATQLPEYDPAAPIAVSVKAGNGTLDAVSVVALGPAGESLQSVLVRVADGSFDGNVSLPDPGAWRLRLTARTGKTVTQTAPVMLVVQAPPPSDAWQIGLAVGTAIFVIVGGGGFLLLRRFLRASARSADAQPA